MSRAARAFGFAVAMTALALQAGAVNARVGAPTLQLSVPGSTQVDTATAIQLTLPAGVAAADGRIFFDRNALEFIGVAPPGAGRALSPVDIKTGVAFGAFGLRAGQGSTVMRLIVVPQVSGSIAVNVVVDATANGQGMRLFGPLAPASATIQSGTSTAVFGAPAPTVPQLPARAAGPARTLVGQRVLTTQDLDAATAAWESARINGGACASVDPAVDANGDGCIDAVDIQAVSTGIGQASAANSAVQMIAPNAQLTGAEALSQAQPASDSASASASNPGAARDSVAYSHTFTVTYSGDTADAKPGDGVCADAQGRCSLRAAMTEANWSHGSDFIGFNIPGNAPVTITIGDVLPFLNDPTGGTTIDAYTQHGSRVNTAQYGSNAIPGIAIKGTADSPQTNIFHITSAGNVIRGFALYRAYRLIGLSGTNATGNTIIGNWMGVDGTGAIASYYATEDIYLDQGPSNNVIGTPNLADRNVIANAQKGIDMYGPGTNNNIIQNNDLCMTPSGARSACRTGIDHDFGPKGTQIGGFATNDKNVIGPTTRNGIEISHGWDPAGKDTSTKWLNMDIHIEGNWVGFKEDGSYSASYRSGSIKPKSDDGNAINVYDGCKDNVVDGNYLAAFWDGVNTMVSNCFDNVIRNNTIGMSPKGQAAPLAWWGVHVREGTYGTVIANNTIRHAALGGIGLVTGNERQIEITHNIVSDTSGPAISLKPASGGSAPGSNSLYAAPVIRSVSTTFVSGTGIAGSTVEIYQASRNAGQSGLPIAFLGTGAVAGNGGWKISVSLAPGTKVTALEIAPNGNTSQLGTNVATKSGAAAAGGTR